MIKIVLSAIVVCIGVIVWSCCYVSGQASKEEEAEFERPDYIRLRTKEE